MIEPQPDSPHPLLHPKPKPEPEPPPQQLQRRRRIIIQLHPFSPELHPPQFVAAKSLIKSSILSCSTTVNLFTILYYARGLGQFPII